jgi:DNA-binding MarR family transcriptional regulator
VEDTGLLGPGLPGFDDDEQCCWQLFLDSSMRMLAMVNGSLMATHRLTLFDVLLLDLLAHSDRSAVRMSALGDALMIGAGRVAKRIRSLEKRELVSRRPTRYDRRGVLVSITSAGRAQLELAVKTYAEEVRAHYLARMSRQQMIALGDSHRQISVPLEALQAAGVPCLAML